MLNCTLPPFGSQFKRLCTQALTSPLLFIHLYCTVTVSPSTAARASVSVALPESNLTYLISAVMERCRAFADCLSGAWSSLYLRLRWLVHLDEMQNMHMCFGVRIYDHSDVNYLVAGDLASDLQGQGTAALLNQVEAPVLNGRG